jgi:diguanylate cyclase (GGDEF)-like protein
VSSKGDAAPTLRCVTAANRHGEVVVSTSLAGFALIFTCLVLFEAPGLGIPHFFYLPVAALAMTGGVRRGVCAGLLATGLFAVGVALNTQISTATQLLSISMPIRILTYTSIGALVGWFAVHDRELVARLQLLAERDFLTGLPNTRAFEAAIARRLGDGRTFTLLLGDMDGLKEINDAKGHAEGNDALRRLADMLGSVLRPEDEVARVGGDEFAVITAHGGGEGAASMAAASSRLSRARACESHSVGRSIHSRARTRSRSTERLTSGCTHASSLGAATASGAPSSRSRARRRPRLGSAAADRLAEVLALESPAAAPTRGRKLLDEDQHGARDGRPAEDEQHHRERKVVLAIVLVACAVALVLGAEWPRVAGRWQRERPARRRRERRKRGLTLVENAGEARSTGDRDDFERSVARDLENLPVLDESDDRSAK